MKTILGIFLIALGIARAHCAIDYAVIRQQTKASPNAGAIEEALRALPQHPKRAVEWLGLGLSVTHDPTLAYVLFHIAKNHDSVPIRIAALNELDSHLRWKIGNSNPPLLFLVTYLGRVANATQTSDAQRHAAWLLADYLDAPALNPRLSNRFVREVERNFWRSAQRMLKEFAPSQKKDLAAIDNVVRSKQEYFKKVCGRESRLLSCRQAPSWLRQAQKLLGQ